MSARPPFRRLCDELSKGDFNAAALDAPFSILTVTGAPPPLSLPKPLRATEAYWRDQGINVRSTLWNGPRGGAPFAAACITLLHRAGRPVWPWAKAPGMLVELVSQFDQIATQILRCRSLETGLPPSRRGGHAKPSGGRWTWRPIHIHCVTDRSACWPKSRESRIDPAFDGGGVVGRLDAVANESHTDNSEELVDEGVAVGAVTLVVG